MRRSIPSIITSVVTGLLFITIGCDSNDLDENGNEIANVQMSPDSVSIPVGGTADFSFDLVTADGDVVEDVEFATEWWSTDTTVFTVEENGLATGRNPGTAKCMIDVVTSKRFVGRDSAIVFVF